MKAARQIFSYLSPFKSAMFFYAFANLFAILFNLASLAMIVPFLRLLFGIENQVKELPHFSFSPAGIAEYFNFYLSQIIEQSGPTQALLFICASVAIVFLFKNLFTYIALFIQAPLRTNVSKTIRNKIHSNLMLLPLSYFSEERKGNLIAKMSSDVNEIETSAVSLLQLLFRDPVQLFVFIASLIWISPSLTLFAFIFIPIGGIIISKISEILKKSAFKMQNKLGEVLSIFEESVNGIKIIKSFNAENHRKQIFETENQSLTSISNKMWRLKDLSSPSSELIAICLVIIVLWIGGNTILSNQSTLSAETFIAFIVIFSQIIPPAKKLSNAYFSLQKGAASLNRIELILNKTESPNSSSKTLKTLDFKHQLELKNVSFAYQQQNVVNNISFTIKKGETIALVGESGSGKTTIADLILRFYEAQEGEILLDGKAINQLNLKTYRNLFGIVNQSPILFNDSIYNNIAFGKNVNEAQIAEASKIASAHQFVNQLKNKYQTNVGENGNKLSGGEKQRITIARAIIHNPEILILDEATSALDSENELLIKAALEKTFH